MAAAAEPLTEEESKDKAAAEKALNDAALAVEKADAAAAEEAGAAEAATARRRDELKAEAAAVAAAKGGKKGAWEGIARRDSKGVTVAQAAGGDWNRFKSYAVWQRTFEIWRFVFTFAVKRVLIGQKWTYSKAEGGMTEENKSKRRKMLAVWLKESLLKLGPTFIKIGQQFSTRVDVLEKEFVEQLSELQDKVPPFGGDVAKSIIEAEFGCTIEDKFEEFDIEPLAAASLGQVHLAKLDGKTVIVKVQRPGLKELFDIDLKNIRAIAVWLNKTDPKSDGAARDWVAIYDETARVLYEEIDYTKEAENATRFRNNFIEAKIDYIKAPEIIWSHTNSQVLTMEYLPGVKISNTEELEKLGVDRRQVARYAVESYLQQILTFGFFHADPHPGNIAVQPDGKLIFYDYGMMGGLPDGVRSGLVDCFYGVYKNNPKDVVVSLEKMGVLVPGKDTMAVTRTASFFLNSFRDRLKAQREQSKAAEAEGIDFRDRGFKERRTKEVAKEVKQQRLAAIGEDLLSIAADQPFRFPATFTFVVRAFSVLDGIGKTLDPRFDISEIARPYAMELLDLKKDRAAGEVLRKDLGERVARNNAAVANLWNGPDRIADVARVVKALEEGELKLRVRNLEAERAFARVAAVQGATLRALACACLVNVWAALQASAAGGFLQAAALAGAGVMGVLAGAGLLKVKLLDKKELKYKGIEA